MSELIEELAGQLGVRVLFQGGLRLITLDDCEKIVEFCKSRNLLILGIEAFRLADGNIVPDTDLIADFSELASRQWEDACLEAARSAESYFCEIKGLTNLCFEFTLKGRD